MTRTIMQTIRIRDRPIPTRIDSNSCSCSNLELRWELIFNWSEKQRGTNSSVTLGNVCRMREIRRKPIFRVPNRNSNCWILEFELFDLIDKAKSKIKITFLYPRFIFFIWIASWFSSWVNSTIRKTKKSLSLSFFFLFRQIFSRFSHASSRVLSSLTNNREEKLIEN